MVKQLQYPTSPIPANSPPKHLPKFSHLLLTISIIINLFFTEFALSSSSSSTKVVKALPGFLGPLPFHLETGYVGVGENEDVQLFYYFVWSERKPKEDPVVLWLTGGPGCSAFSGFAFEIGPLNFHIVKYNESLPTLVLNPYSWTKIASIIFLDSPVGTGFSYSRSLEGSITGDFKTCNQINEFLRKWLIGNPDFASNPIYVGGDSYSGMTVPLVVQHISDGIEAGSEPFINLTGYLLGNPVTDPLQNNYIVPFAHGTGLISEELYESLKRSCAGEYTNVNPKNTLCLQNLDYLTECTSGLNNAHILEPSCAIASPKPRNTAMYRRSLSANLKEFVDPKHQTLLGPPTPLPEIRCRSYAYLLAYYWANDKSVRKALGIREGTVEEWHRCDYSLPYKNEYPSSFPFHVNLSKRGYPSLIYSGDHDLLVPHISTQAWIKQLSYSIVDDWRSWSVDGQVGGYTRTYSNKMTFATVKGGGHTAPEYKPKECYAMFERWISNEGL